MAIQLRLPRDPFFVSAAAGGEQLVARIRLLILSLLLLIQLLPGWDPRIHMVGLATNSVGVAWATFVLLALRRRYRPWMGVVSSLVDVTLVSAGLLAYILLERPHFAVNSRVLFEVYYLVLGCASLRYDWRVCAAATVTAVAQYAALTLYASWRFDLNDFVYAPFVYGTFSWTTQIARLILLSLAGVLSVAIVLRAQRLRHLSTVDRLTGLHNRGVFDERLAEEFARAKRFERPLTVALLDLDHFKAINDAHGHAAGDATLREVADVLRASVRQMDILVRYGGEEFAIIMPEVRAQRAVARLEELRRAVQIASIGPSGRGAPRVSFSAGVAGWPEDGIDVSAVVARADARLYEAKAAGRNRVVGPPPEPEPVAAGS